MALALQFIERETAHAVTDAGVLDDSDELQGEPGQSTGRLVMFRSLAFKLFDDVSRVSQQLSPFSNVRRVLERHGDAGDGVAARERIGLAASMAFILWAVRRIARTCTVWCV